MMTVGAHLKITRDKVDTETGGWSELQQKGKGSDRLLKYSDSRNRSFCPSPTLYRLTHSITTIYTWEEALQQRWRRRPTMMTIEEEGQLESVSLSDEKVGSCCC